MSVRTLEFEDRGQDFLEWDIDAAGVVIACRPFQEWVWNGTKVSNPRLNKRPTIATPRSSHWTELNYRIVRIRRKRRARR